MNYLKLFRLISLSAILYFAVLLQANTIVSGDITWLMQVGKRLLAGGHYYRDFIEVNPPMAIYIYLIPVILSALLPISVISSVTLYTFWIAALAWLACRYLLRKIFAPADKAKRYLFESMLAFSFFIAPTYAFGQREHFLVMLMLPYLLLAVLRLQRQAVSPTNAILIGISAGIAFSIKPFFSLPWLLIECYMLLKTRSLKIGLRIEMLSCIGLFLIYSISILIVTPDYITQTVTLINPVYYFNYRALTLQLLLNNLVIFSAIILLIYWRARKTLTYSILGDLLAISAISMLAVYFIQQTLWFYHILPALIFITLVLTLITGAYLSANNIFKAETINLHFLEKMSKSFILCFLFIYLFFVAFSNTKISFYITKFIFDNPIYNIAKSADGKPIYIFTDNIAINYPLLDYAQTHSPSSFPGLWLITAAHKLKQTDNSPAKQQLATYIANFARTTDVNNIIKQKPLFIFVQLKYNSLILNRNFLFTYSSKINEQPAFDFLNFFLQNPQFARFWQTYRYVKTINNFAIYKRI